MKKHYIFIVILIEIIGIVCISTLYAFNYSEFVVMNIAVPEGLKLTLNKDISINTNDGAILIPKDTVINPKYIFPDNTVCFYYNETTERLHTEWENIYEQGVLDDLKHEAELRQEAQQRKIKTRGLIVGIFIGVFWLFIGGIISFEIIKKEKYTLLTILHSIIIAVIVLILYSRVIY